MAERKMPDRPTENWSNITEIIKQYRALGYSDTYIIETIINIAETRKMNGKEFAEWAKQVQQ